MENAIGQNIGHFEKAIDLACLEGLEGRKVDNGTYLKIVSSSLLVNV